MYKKIPFSPPDITEEEISAVSEILRSGWITTGPNTALFEKELADYCGTQYAVALNSATAGMELILKVLGIGGDDEVITTPYTYAATANVLVHRGIMPTFVDVKKGSFLIDEEKIYSAITPKTKAIMTVDIAGVPVDYDAIRQILKTLGREDITLISDSAHSFGAAYKGQKVGGQMDFHVFSFHAVKNLTTAEGGAITYNDNSFKGKEDLYREFKYTSLHGQNKDALSKTQAGAWKYDILTDGFKCNMTDIMAAIGRVQLRRHEEMIRKRAEIHEVYSEILGAKEWAILPLDKNHEVATNYHLYTLRLKDFSEEQRDRVIRMLGERDIATNVHFMPLPMFTFYRNLGYRLEDYPNAHAQYANEITLPLYSKLTVDEAEYVAKELIECIEMI
ncbi:DegT/DnrJ/EryC1/StrS family aminotransferase [Desulfosporosinus meridiei]|uniref:Putative PLP-dependent enzyme possibly involved in cell wall biogenesis n=1 Tax=Desulfosporosinus meridiei (strain ATCC BAA-275 / DSM 13257 / KCTC 12902 / NCIMB 13706 / S10) TaxID=768704 RepID=J7IX24_DESMD|nr:DegT/DnrJ/EryC1/StrS aminotransferase family protein [Desulfosporosinus meridiei]AFQ43266.1 putative PLP-dependent enzyme possibly involved in cell wall biogenesis [Desulfosporosinus meridiei DSM 13257]